MTRRILQAALLLLVLVVPSQATDYYVDNTNGSASDSNAGTNPAAPWLTIGKCASTIVGGDVCNVAPGGTYDARVTETTSGSAGNVIKYLATSGTRPKVRAFTVSNADYVWIEGFELTMQSMSSDNTATISISSGSDHVTIKNNYIHDTTATCISYNGVTFLHVLDNEATLCFEHSVAAGTDTGNKTITAGVNDQVKYKVQGGASNTITLTAGTRTATQICTDLINGVSGVGCFIGNGGNVNLESSTRGPTSSLEIETVANNAYTEIGFTVGVQPMLSTQSPGQFVSGGATSSSDILIENNNGYQLSDFVTTGDDSRVIIRNNTWGPNNGQNAGHLDGVQTNGSNGGTRILFEGNLSKDQTNFDNHIVLYQRPTDLGHIVRYNVFDNARGGVQWSSADNCSYYNNTMYGAGALGASFQIYATSNGTGNVSRNNIWYNASTSNPYVVDAGSSIDRDYDLYFGGTANPGLTHQVNADPVFVDASGHDFHIQASSNAKDAGGALTNVATADGGSGTTLVLDEAYLFQDGWGGATPDCIAVGTVSNTACISSIDYSTNTVTLVAGITRNDGDSVWLYSKSDGEVVLVGTAPDMGAFEFDEGADTTAPTPGNSGTITTANVATTSLTLNWTKATDDTSDQSALQYEVRRSGSNNIDTVNNAETNGTIIGSYTTDIATHNATGLSASTTYYFNVIVKDEAGNKAVYTTKSETTAAAASASRRRLR